MRHLAHIIFLSFALGMLGACNTTIREGQEQPRPSVSIEKNSSELKKNAQASFKSGQYGDSVKSYYAVLQKKPDDHEARLGLAESYFRLGNGEQAQINFEKLLSIPQYELVALQGVGLSKLQRGKADEAQTFLKDAVDNDSTLWRSWNGLAQIYDSKAEWRQSAHAYEMALAHADRPEVIYNNMGVSFMAQEDFEKAAHAFNRALEHSPDLEAARTNYRLALAMQDRYEEATLEHNVHEEAKALNNAGYAAMRRGNFLEAERLFLKSIEVNPSFYKPAYENLQVLYYLKNQKSKQD